MSRRRTGNRLARASKARLARKPGMGEASPDLPRWLSARRLTAHLLMFLGGLATLAALVTEPTLEKSAGALLAMWGAGLGSWGLLALLERRSLRAHREAERAQERQGPILPVRSAAKQSTLTLDLSRREKRT